MSDWVRCPYFDCGFCMADEEDSVNTGSQGDCKGYGDCDYFNEIICKDRDPEVDDGK